MLAPRIETGGVLEERPMLNSGRLRAEKHDDDDGDDSLRATLYFLSSVNAN
jgi:hypothetical protein